MYQMVQKLHNDKPEIERKLRSGIRYFKNSEIIIKQADKNMGLTAIRGDIYRAMVRKELGPGDFIEVTSFPHTEIFNRLANIVNTHFPIKNIGQRWLDSALKATSPNPFYIIPKIHKPKVSTRPITATHSYMLAEVSKALALHFQQKVNEFPNIAQDTRSVIRRLEETKIYGDFILVTYDVERLYPSIDIRNAIRTLSVNMPARNRGETCWLKLLQLVMYNNYVSYDSQIYRQMKGTATGTQVAPPFANLYLHFLFKDTLHHPSILFESRYIDDGFMVIRNREDAQDILQKLNTCSNLRLTWEIHEYKAVFLDLIIHKGLRWKYRNILDITTYFKPTNKLLYLPYSSSHPRHMKLGIAKGESIRLLRNNCHKEDWIKQCVFVFKGLMARGYPPRMIKQAWKTVRFEDRNKYIFEDRERTRPKGDIIITSFHPLTQHYWKFLCAKFPFQDVLVPKRLGKYNKAQCNLLQRWPPRILFGKFDKIGNKLISARQSWRYPMDRKRKGLQQYTGVSSSKRRRTE